MDVFEQNYFALFGLPTRFELDRDALQAAYLRLQSVVHPDRCAAAGPAERRWAIQGAMRVNEAYRTLLDPGQRAAYVLACHGAAPSIQGLGGADQAFLFEQLEWRESLQAARQAGDRAGLMHLKAMLEARRAALLQDLGRALDELSDWAQAACLLRRWMFVDKFGAEVAAAEDSVAPEGA